jgi:alanine racemase
MRGYRQNLATGAILAIIKQRTFNHGPESVKPSAFSAAMTSYAVRCLGTGKRLLRIAKVKPQTGLSPEARHIDLMRSGLIMAGGNPTLVLWHHEPALMGA